MISIFNEFATVAIKLCELECLLSTCVMGSYKGQIGERRLSSDGQAALYFLNWLDKYFLPSVFDFIDSAQPALCHVSMMCILSYSGHTTLL